MGGLPGVLVALLTFGSVLLHEFGHALVARHLRVPVASIDLSFFGGAARMTDLPRSPGDEIAIAAAGPAVSFALAGLGHGLAAVTGLPFFALFGLVNLFIGAFNLLPAFPSDGGRILRALLARRHGLVRATDLAVKVGRVVCVALAAYGLFAQGSFWLVAVAALLWTMGGAERMAVRLRGAFGDWPGSSRPAPEVEYIPPPGSPAHSSGSPERQPSRVRPPTVVIWRP